jgi:type II secretory pathway predicted ATPase ExeA
MLLDFYQLREQPFGVTPDPRYIYFSPGHQEALTALLYGVETKRGFLTLVAEPGMGKTTLLFELLKCWRDRAHSAFLFHTQCDSRELMRYLLSDLGLKCDGDDMVRMHSDLNEFLFRETLAGRSVVIFIDEAQNLTDTVLETVRLLSNFEATDKKLLNIVLAGQPELAKRLSHPGLAQLRQRIAIQARLDALPPAEVVRYINHRLQVAGYQGGDLFSPEAYGLIAERSKGIPRLINNLCFTSLSLGCAMQRKQITSEVVEKAVRNLSLRPRAPASRVPRQQAALEFTTRLQPVWQSFHAWIRGKIVKRRLIQGLAFCVACGGFVSYFGARNRAAAIRSSEVILQNFGSASAARSPDLISARPVADTHGEPQAHDFSPDGALENTANSFRYVVKPKDTLRDLCVSVLGRYDKVVLAKIQELNPNLGNPDQLETGQVIRFPLNPPKRRDIHSRSK